MSWCGGCCWACGGFWGACFITSKLGPLHPSAGARAARWTLWPATTVRPCASWPCLVPACCAPYCVVCDTLSASKQSARPPAAAVIHSSRCIWPACAHHHRTPATPTTLPTPARCHPALPHCRPATLPPLRLQMPATQGGWGGMSRPCTSLAVPSGSQSLPAPAPMAPPRPRWNSWQKPWRPWMPTPRWGCGLGGQSRTGAILGRWLSVQGPGGPRQ